jgi:ATP-dependent protease HslVU (ClpYQ) peptidase subunit
MEVRKLEEQQRRNIINNLLNTLTVMADEPASIVERFGKKRLSLTVDRLKRELNTDKYIDQLLEHLEIMGIYINSGHPHYIVSAYGQQGMAVVVKILREFVKGQIA